MNNFTGMMIGRHPFWLMGDTYSPTETVVYSVMTVLLTIFTTLANAMVIARR